MELEAERPVHGGRCMELGAESPGRKSGAGVLKRSRMQGV